MGKNTKPVVYAFIDSQNLNLGVRSSGWRIDYKKFRLYLKNKYGVDRAFMFIGLVSNNQKLYTKLQETGFILVFKPTIRYYENGKETVKGNVDAELVLHAAAIEYPNYHKAIIVTGDGDFACLVEFLADRKKLLHVFTPNNRYSKLLRPYSQYIVELSRLKTSLAHKNKKTSIGGQSKP
ncbi:MAG TPA: NYN domain-containing protein [Candidatus Saccharimonadales bacterium]|nr:NYN domain-containing protein [Candidatus Saccharimonadales bacterium]